jgi:hypothetical protein
MSRRRVEITCKPSDLAASRDDWGDTLDLSHPLGERCRPLEEVGVAGLACASAGLRLRDQRLDRSNGGDVGVQEHRLGRSGRLGVLATVEVEP